MTLRRLTAGLLATFALLTSTWLQAADRLRPFVLASETEASVEESVASTRSALVAAGFEVIGDYSPFQAAHVLIFTSGDLQAIAAKTDNGAFGAVLRAAVTELEGKTQVSYVNPRYLAKAYRLDDDLSGVADTLANVLGAERDYGSKKGQKPKGLTSYRYMFGMEQFDDTYALAEFDSQQAAVDTVAARLADNTLGLSQVYRLELPEQDAVLFGVAMAPEGEDDKYYNDEYQMSVVDFSDIRSTAYLPYEVLVEGGKVQAMHMRFRMAVHFPDLSMMGKHSFMTLVPSPKAIEKALRGLTVTE